LRATLTLALRLLFALGRELRFGRSYPCPSQRRRVHEARRDNVNANWHPPGHDDVTFGMEISHQSNLASVLNDQVTVPDKTFVNADARYSFALDGRAASLRLWVQNIFDYRTWDVSDADTYDIHGFSGRHVALRLIVDM
jgi:outer membrane receptor protein involved in Fe transport